MANPPLSTPPGDDVAQVTPPDLHRTSDIRFVMWEMGKLTTAVEALTKATEKLSDRFDKQGDKVEELRRALSFVRGIVWVFGILGVTAVPVLAWLLNHSFPPPAPIPLQPTPTVTSAPTP